MSKEPTFGRRAYDAAQCVVELVKHCHLTPDDFAAIVNALALRAAAFDAEGWWGMDSVEAGLAEASGCLEEVRAPGHEKRDAEDDRHQRELREWVYGRGL